MKGEVAAALLFAVMFPVFMLSVASFDLTIEEIKTAEQMCEPNGGVKEIYVYRFVSPTAICNNTAKFDVREKK